MVMKAILDGFAEPIVSIDMADEEWRQVRYGYTREKRRRGKYGSNLFCPDCAHPLYPKQNERGTRFFAHMPDAPDTCPLKAVEGESPEHRLLKIAIYRTARKVKGWTADLEVRAPEADPLTGHPVVVDVVAKREAAPIAAGGGLQGWEVQTTAMDEGTAMERQEHRDRWLSRCTWVTRTRPQWAERLPWYEVQMRTEHHGDLVVDGVVEWHELGGGRGGVFEPVGPFPHEQMVRSVLRGALWQDGIGWQLRPDGKPRTAGRRLPRKESIKRSVAAYCAREQHVPDIARNWSETEWQRCAVAAFARRDRGERLTDVHISALARFAALTALPDVDENAYGGGYDHLTDAWPCVLCGEIVIVSDSHDYPMHHACRWRAQRRAEPTTA